MYIYVYVVKPHHITAQHNTAQRSTVQHTPCKGSTSVTDQLVQSATRLGRGRNIRVTHIEWSEGVHGGSTRSVNIPVLLHRIVIVIRTSI